MNSGERVMVVRARSFAVAESVTAMVEARLLAEGGDIEASAALVGREYKAALQAWQRLSWCVRDELDLSRRMVESFECVLSGQEVLLLLEEGCQGTTPPEISRPGES